MPHHPVPLRNRLLSGGESAPIQAMRLLFWLRVLAISSQALVIGFVHYVLEISLPLAPLAATLLGLAAWNTFVWIRMRKSTVVVRAEVALNLCVDILAFTSVIYFTGGPTNPFVSLYLLPISLAAVSLPAFYAWVVTAICAGGYTFLLLSHVPLPSVHDRFGGDFDLHVAGMWVNFLVAGALIVFFVGWIARMLRQRDRELAALREDSLRDQQLIALGTLAASAAHDINTPLATLSLLVEELEESLSITGGDTCLKAMHEQIGRISQRLTNLANDAGADRSERACCTRVTAFVENLMKQWRLTHPTKRLSVRLDLDQGDVDMIAEGTMELAIRNVLDNAAQAVSDGTGQIDVVVSASGEQLCLMVTDNGPGLPPAIEQVIGERIVSTKPGGLGIGLLLSRASLERFGGCLQLRNRPSGGVEACILMPLNGRLADAR
jgi:two-component system, sensor histidine kinase RegB